MNLNGIFNKKEYYLKNALVFVNNNGYVILTLPPYL